MLKLDGAGEFIALPDVMYGGTDTTWEMWVFARDPSRSGQTLFDVSDSVSGGVIRLALSGSGFMVYTVDNRPTSGAVAQTLQSLMGFPRQRWTHVAVVHTTAAVTMYWDGVVQVWRVLCARVGVPMRVLDRQHAWAFRVSPG
jgi:hypothetical protein